MFLLSVYPTGRSALSFARFPEKKREEQAFGGTTLIRVAEKPSDPQKKLTHP
jgi:hypothetical protein